MDISKIIKRISLEELTKMLKFYDDELALISAFHTETDIISVAVAMSEKSSHEIREKIFFIKREIEDMKRDLDFT